MVFLARENIAMPDSAKNQLIYKWPDLEIRKFSHLIVEGDYQAMFTLQGEIKQVLERPGRYPLDATELPGLGIIIDALTGNNRFRAELYYVSRREIADRFGGAVDNVLDPVSGIPVRLAVYGEYMVRIAEPQALIYKITGTQNVPDNSTITDRTDNFVITALREAVVTKINDGTWKIFGLAGYTHDIQQTVCELANQNAADYGLQITRLTQFNINLDDESRAQVDTYYQRRSMIGLASQAGGNYERAAAAEVQFGAGAGLAQGGGNAPILMGMGVGLGQQAMQAPPAPPPPASPQLAGGAAPGGAAAGVACPSCGTQNALGARFCNSCGAAMVPPAATCPSCRAENAVQAKFCSSCGASMQAQPANPQPATPQAATEAQPATCAGCGAQLAAGARFCASCGRPLEQ